MTNSILLNNQNTRHRTQEMSNSSNKTQVDGVNANYHVRFARTKALLSTGDDNVISRHLTA